MSWSIFKQLIARWWNPSSWVRSTSSITNKKLRFLEYLNLYICLDVLFVKYFIVSFLIIWHLIEFIVTKQCVTCYEVRKQEENWGVEHTVSNASEVTFIFENQEHRDTVLCDWQKKNDRWNKGYEEVCLSVTRKWSSWEKTRRLLFSWNYWL